jgi:GrpB-like predicted nucleotidyltransferase (UPF0157 family)
MKGAFVLNEDRELDEPISLVSHDPSWPERALALASEVGVALGDLKGSIEHIGSTAIAGMLAKPIIDLMIGVEAPSVIESVAARLRNSGWDDLGEAGVTGRRYFRRRLIEAANLHLVQRGGEHWIDNLALRDYLRAHPDEALAYGRLKQEIIMQGHRRLLAYSAHKATHMSALVAKARRHGELTRGKIV